MSKRSWVDRRTKRFDGIDDAVTDIGVIDIPAIVQGYFERLRESCFEKQPFADGFLGTGCPGESDRWR